MQEPISYIHISPQPIQEPLSQLNLQEFSQNNLSVQNNISNNDLQKSYEDWQIIEEQDNSQQPMNGNEDNSSKKSKSQSESDQLDEQFAFDGCSCIKSNCLRLYCSCYKNQDQCTERCKCLNCLNFPKYEDVRQMAIQKTKLLKKFAFEPQTTEIDNCQVMKFGCNCKKGCINKRCQCFQNGVGCYQYCDCLNCKNNKRRLRINSEERKPDKRRFAKRYKIQIDYDKVKNQEDGIHVSIVPHTSGKKSNQHLL